MCLPQHVLLRSKLQLEVDAVMMLFLCHPDGVTVTYTYIYD